MSQSSMRRPTRRAFFEKAVALTAVMPLMPRLVQGVAGFFLVAPTEPAAAAPRAPFVDPASPYRSLSRDEAAFTETMVNVLCPADALTPNGVTCGLAMFIDRELAGDVGTDRRARVARQHGKAQFFKAGIAAANTAAQERFGVRFSQLAAPDAGAFLRDIAAGHVIDTDVPLAFWLNQLVYPLLMQACFAGPIYDGYTNKVFWKLFGYVGGPCPTTVEL